MGTNVELAILGALAETDVLLINATHDDSHFWRVETVFIMVTQKNEFLNFHGALPKKCNGTRNDCM